MGKQGRASKSRYKIYYCKNCRTAWDYIYPRKEGKRVVDYYPKWIKGDEYKKCPRCEDTLHNKKEK